LTEKSILVLASTSPRRKDLLNQVGIKVSQVVPPQINEEKFSKFVVTKMVVNLALLKATEVRKKIKNKKAFIIAGDTAVYRTGKVYKKTDDKKIVKKYLCELSAKKHFVYSGICIISPDGIISKRLVKTEVYFNRIPIDQLNNKLLIEEGIGKAGGYAIQGIASKFVKKIKGSYSNVVGLSLSDVNDILLGLGWK